MRKLIMGSGLTMLAIGGAAASEAASPTDAGAVERALTISGTRNPGSAPVTKQSSDMKIKLQNQSDMKIKMTDFKHSDFKHQDAARIKVTTSNRNDFLK